MATLRNTYWNLYTVLKYREFYFERYFMRAQRIDNILSGTCTIVSLGCVTTWGIWKFLPWLLSSVVAIAQIIQAIRPYLPYTRQVNGLKYFIPAYKDVVNKVGQDWLSIDTFDNDQIRKRFNRYDSQSDALESQFLSDIRMPNNKKLQKAAETDCVTFLYQRYDIGGDNTNGEEKEYNTATAGT